MGEGLGWRGMWGLVAKRGRVGGGDGFGGIGRERDIDGGVDLG